MNKPSVLIHREFNQHSGTVVMVTHDLGLIASDIIVIHVGEDNSFGKNDGNHFFYAIFYLLQGLFL
ncbi:hypothetical protein ESCOCP342M_22940 [Escherichia coli]|nr:Uncharacterised protein [Escherichia coli]